MTDAAGVRGSDVCGEGVPLKTVGVRVLLALVSTISADEPRTTVTSAIAVAGLAAAATKTSANAVAKKRVDSI